MRAARRAPGDDPRVAGLFGGGVLAATAPVLADEGGLFPEEALLVARAVAKRRREFAAARRCARALLARLGEPARPLLRTPERAPCWPEGVVGSISHSDALVAVAVARRAQVAGLGIDVEPDLALEPALWRKICTPAEIARLAGADEAARGRSARLVFSAKEALYKCVHAHARRVIGFQEVEVELDPDGGFTASLPGDVHAALPSGVALVGSFVRREGFVLTGAALTASAG